MSGSLIHAQSIIPPTYNESSVSPLTSAIYTVNTDMFELPGGTKLTAVVWDAYSPAGVHIKVSNTVGGTSTLYIPSFAESTPDVVLANDLSNPTRYILGVVYLNSDHYVTLNTYYIFNAGTSGLLVKDFASIVISDKEGYYPHIDMFPDFSNYIGSFPSFHKFVISYEMFDNNTPPTMGVYENSGDMANPLNLSPPYFISNGTININPQSDVAASYDAVQNLQHAYIVFNKANGLFVAQLNFDPAAPANNLPVGSPIVQQIGNVNALLPRIESMSYNPTGSNIVPWVVGGIIWNGSVHQIFEYNPLVGSINCTAGNPILASSDNYSVAVTAALGVQNGNVCNENYNIGWYTPKSGYMTQVIDAHTGGISTSAPNYYVANNYAVPLSLSKVPIALSSCSNSGNYLLTAWWNGVDSIMYKLKPGIAQYKPAPTGAANIQHKNSINLYPNPTNSLLYLNGLATTSTSYKIYDIFGKLILQGNISNSLKRIDVASLSPGIYIISLTDKSLITNLRFTKI